MQNYRWDGWALTEIQHLLVTHQHSVTPGSLLGKALHYLEAQWPKLIRYVENGAWPIDNNLCENAIRPFVVGRRNWLFADTGSYKLHTTTVYLYRITVQVP